MTTRLREWNKALEARLTSRAGSEVCGIELCDDDASKRTGLLNTVREALDGGLSPANIGLAFIAALSDLTYEVDWQNQFRFWPIVDRALRAERWHLVDDAPADLLRRRECARAFAAFTAVHAGISPGGTFADLFPHMSPLLFHAVLPRCAHRGLARIIERAANSGALMRASSAQGMLAELRALGATSRAIPAYLSGLLGHSAAVGRVVEALLADPETAPAGRCSTRILTDIRRDDVAAECLLQARAQAAGGRRRVVASRPTAPASLTLLLREDGSAILAAELGPLKQHVGVVEGLDGLMRAFGQVRGYGVGVDTESTFLINARDGVLRMPLALDGPQAEISFRVQPQQGALARGLQAYFESARIILRPPLAFVMVGLGEYRVDAYVDDDQPIAILLRNSDARREALIASGFQQASLEGASELVALLGRAAASHRAMLREFGLVIRPTRVCVRPVLVAPQSQRRGTLVYARGDDAWLLCEAAQAVVAVHATLDDAALRVHAIAPGVPALIHVPADGLRVDRVSTLRVFGRGGEPLSLELRAAEASPIEPEVRCRVTLEPASATTAMFLAGVCWLEVQALPGLRIIVRVEAPRVEPVVRELDPLTCRTPIDGWRVLSEIVDELRRRGLVNIEEGDGIRFLAGAVDEASSLREICALRPASDPIRFDVTHGQLSFIAGEDPESAVWSNLQLGREGYTFLRLSEKVLPENGLLVAACGGERVAVACAASDGAVPRFDGPVSTRRGRKRLVELVSTLRCVDVAALGDEAGGRALVLRHAAIRYLERELVLALCGREWLRKEEESEGANEIQRLVAAFGPLLRVRQAWLQGVTEVDDPFDLVDAAWNDLYLGDGKEYAEHLLLLFYHRARARQDRDDAALEWAWADSGRARLVRFCYLASPLAFVRRRVPESRAEVGHEQ